MRSILCTVLFILLSCFCVAQDAALPTQSTDTGSPRVKVPHIERLEVLTTNGAPGSSHGGHQSRVVRTARGVFVVYACPAEGEELKREWRLAQRTDEAGWQVVATFLADRDPVHLLAEADGRLRIIGWRDLLPRIWSTASATETLPLVDEPIEGGWRKAKQPYGAAGIGPEGQICVLQCVTGVRLYAKGNIPGKFNWAYRVPRLGTFEWDFQTTPMPLRECYPQIFPGPGRRLILVADRDVTFEDVGVTRPKDRETYPYVFNAFSVWRSEDVTRFPLSVAYSREEKITTDSLSSGIRAWDAYLDGRDRLHVLYSLNNRSVGQQRGHLVLDGDTVLRDVSLPDRFGDFPRIVQDAEGRFYVFSIKAIVYPATSEDGTELGEPVPLDLGPYGHGIEYAGIMLAVPRGGTPPADIVDGIFATDNGRNWVYFRLRLR